MREEIDRKYLEQANALEAEYFDIEYDERLVLDKKRRLIGYRAIEHDGEILQEPVFEIIEIPRIERTNFHRQLKDDKSLEEFNQRHGEIWHNHEAELIINGYLQPREIL